MLERAMGARLATLLESEIWSRLAAQHDATIVVDPSGFPHVGAGMNACARDLANFGLMMINDGAFDGRSLTTQGYLDSALNRARQRVSPKPFASVRRRFTGAGSGRRIALQKGGKEH